MKILFVANNIGFIDPIGMMLVSALAKKRGHETFLGVLSRENVLEKARQIKPDMVAYSVTTGEQDNCLKFNQAIKKEFPNIFSIMGGPHPTFFPKVVKQGDLDAICIGEADEAFPELLEHLEHNKNPRGIRNILFKGQDLNDLELRPPYQNLDDLPFPDRDLIYKNKHTDMAGFPIKSFMKSRGCLFSCTYCFNKPLRELYRNHGHQMPFIRNRSVENIISEICEVRKKYPLKFIKFYDDMFVDKVDDWLYRFVKQYKKEVNVPFQCLLRINLVTEDMVKLLKEAGCVSVNISIEAGNPEVRAKILNRHMTNEEIIRGFELFNKYNLPSFCNNIFALPGFGLKYDIETLDLNLKSKVTYALFGSLYLYPGTDIGKYCEERGYINPDFHLHSWYQSRSPLNCFTEKEKDRSYKLSVLGTVIVAFPKLRNFVIKHLDYIPNFLAFLAFNLVQTYLVQKKIYPVKMGLLKTIKYGLKSIELELIKRTIKEQK